LRLKFHGSALRALAPREDAMGLVAFGGFVVTTKSGNLRKRAEITDEKLKQIADILGISVDDLPKAKDEILSMFIYRGGKPPPK
jgi:hypothetical protein